MKNLVITSALFAVVAIASILAIASQRRSRAALETEAADLRRQTARLVQEQVESQRLATQIAREVPAPVASAAPVATSTAPAVTPTVENRDPSQGMVATEHLRAVGHATPGDAFQTLVWAALNGQDELLAGSFSLSDGARAKLETLLAGMDANARKKFTVPESVPALLLAREILKKTLRLQIVSVDATADDTATVHTKITTRVGRLSSQSFPMRRVNGKWTFAAEDKMIDSMIESLSRQRP
ncbi:MAG: hypothetical protein ABIR80_17715 [Opitutaceae bacterium]